MSRDNVISEQQINIEFVKQVQKHPTLYNFELPSYARKDVCDQAWEEIGKATNMTPSACRERWRNLRAVFMRTLKAQSKNANKKKPYYLRDVMQFVVPFMRPFSFTDNEKKKSHGTNQMSTDSDDNPIIVEVEQIKLEPDDDSEDWSTQSVEEEKEVKNKRKRPAPEDEHNQSKKATPVQHSLSVGPEIDHVKSFLNSLVPELNEMNLAQFKNFKRRVLILIDDITTEMPSNSRQDENDFFNAII